MTSPDTSYPLQAMRLELVIRDCMDTLSDVALEQAWTFADCGLEILSIQPEAKEHSHPNDVSDQQAPLRLISV